MWHCFDIMQDELAVEPTVRQAKISAAGRAVYTELALRYFADKSGEGQWPANVDRREGLSVAREPGDSGTWTLAVEHTRRQTVPHTLELTMTCQDNDWRSPRRWQSREHFGDASQHSRLATMTGSGVVEQGRVTHELASEPRRMRESYSAAHAASMYALLADFPADAADAGRLAEPGCDGLLGDGMQWVGRAWFDAEVPTNMVRRDIGEGLRCYRLRPAWGLPLEYWVNDQGTVVYLLEGPTRAWVLRSVEAVR